MVVSIRTARLRENGRPVAHVATAHASEHMPGPQAQATHHAAAHTRTHIPRRLTGGSRPVRFAITGGTAAIAQLGLLEVFTRASWHALAANAVAFLLSAQLNFVLSTFFTWRDRFDRRSIGRRWLAFHASISGMALVNMLVFAVARLALPNIAASALGIIVAAAGNFLLGDRLVFREQSAGSHPGDNRAESAA